MQANCRSVVGCLGSRVEGGTEKGHEETLAGGESWLCQWFPVYIYVRMRQIVSFEVIQFIFHKLYFNRVDEK